MSELRFALTIMFGLCGVAYVLSGLITTSAWIAAVSGKIPDKAGGWGWGMTASWLIAVICFAIAWQVFGARP